MVKKSTTTQLPLDKVQAKSYQLETSQVEQISQLAKDAKLDNSTIARMVIDAGLPIVAKELPEFLAKLKGKENGL